MKLIFNREIKAAWEEMLNQVSISILVELKSTY